MALSRLVSYASHDNVNIRYAVACSLGSYSEESSINALLSLATDEDDDVRNWATFGLGSMHETIDTPAIRGLLWHNIDDKNEDVSGEALVGLAIRKDPRMIDVLKVKLTLDFTDYVYQAVEYMNEPILNSYLEKIE